MKILIYGDSFAAPRKDLGTPGWTEMLSRSMKLPMLNRAIDGGSTDNAMLKFVKDIKNKKINEDDIVIFVMSTPGRLHLSYQIDYPETASPFLHEVPETYTHYRWYKKNRKYILWYLANSDKDLFSIQHESYYQTLKGFAAANPKNIVIFLENSPHYCSLPGIPYPENFLRPNVYLNWISNNEYLEEGTTFRDWIKHTVYDVRENHFCIPNLKILSSLIQQSIETKQVENFTYDKFESKIYNPIESIKDYEFWVEKGYIYNCSWRRKNIKN